MKKIFVLLFVACSVAATEIPLKLQQLVPTPQEINSKGEALFSTSHYRLRDRLKLPEATKKYFRDELEKRLNWSEKPEPGVAVIEISPVFGQKNPEYYTLDISGNSIKIGAATVTAGQRAIGRLLGLIEQLQITPVSGKTTLPAIAIRDWPDFPFRGLHFQIGGPFSQWRYDHTEHIIDAMGRLGYTHAMLELGGRIECPKHPEITRKPAWPDKKVREIIAFANARGIKVLPGINGPGHMASGPRIFPLPRKKSNGRVIKEDVMDLSNPQFYTVWFDYVDKVAELFGNPEYFSVGSDEFHGGASTLEKKLGRKTSDYYPEFLRRTAEHLAKRGIKTCAWHDMMVDADKYKKNKYQRGEPANGSPETLKNIPPEITIMYWNYFYRDCFNVLEDIRKAKPKNEIWVTVWSDPDNIEHLLKTAKSMGITHVLGSIWGSAPNLIGIPATAEFAWNLKNPWNKDQKLFDRLNDRFFYSRSDKTPEVGGRSLLKSGKAIEVAADLPPKELSLPWKPDELIGKRLLLYIPDSFEWARSGKVHVNAQRSGDGLWFYTPSWGKSTRTNIWGSEIAVINGVVSDVSGTYERHHHSESGNMAIPRDGVVLSMRNVIDCGYHRRTTSLAGLAEPGRVLKLYQIPDLPEKSQMKKIEFPDGTKHLIFNFTTKRPFDRKVILATITVINAKGGKSIYNFCSRDFIRPSSQPTGWSQYLVSFGKRPVLGVEFDSPTPLRAMVIEPRPDAALSGLVISRLDVH